MKLTITELTWIRNNLLAARSYRYTNVPLKATLWEPWKEGFLQKITDELYPQEFDKL
jgi:hypothetical protein